MKSIYDEQLLQLLCWPISDQSFWGNTIHSEFNESVPAELDQSELPWEILHFLINVWSLVALLIPATLHPEPGSPLKSPIWSNIMYSTPGSEGVLGSAP